MSLARRIQHYRHRNHLSQDALAKQAKLNYNTLIKLESGVSKNPTLKTLRRVANALEVTIDWLTR